MAGGRARRAHERRVAGEEAKVDQRRDSPRGYWKPRRLRSSFVRRGWAGAGRSGCSFREIRVDVWPLRASAGDPTADWVEKELPGHLTRALSAYLAPAERNGATLVARIQDVNFGQSGGRGGATGASQDSIQGVLIVGGLRAGIAAQTPLRAMAAYSPNAADEALIEEAYHGRVVALAQAFAGRVPGELGL
jgi:hypothetical protein